MNINLVFNSISNNGNIIKFVVHFPRFRIGNSLSYILVFAYQFYFSLRGNLCSIYEFELSIIKIIYPGLNVWTYQILLNVNRFKKIYLFKPNIKIFWIYILFLLRYYSLFDLGLNHRRNFILVDESVQKVSYIELLNKFVIFLLLSDQYWNWSILPQDSLWSYHVVECTD